MAEHTFKLQIVSPDRIFYEGEAVMAEMTTTEGAIGVYAGHIPMTHILEPGIFHITEAWGQDKYAAVHNGFVEILPDKITVLAETAEWPEEIDVNRASAAKERAQKQLLEQPQGQEDTQTRAAFLRAVARLELAQRCPK